MPDNALPECGAFEVQRPAGKILEDATDAPQGIQDAHRSLHDVAEAFPPCRLDLLRRGGRDIEVARPEVIGGAAGDDPQGRPSRRREDLDEARLARRTLAGNAIDLVPADAHRNVVDGPDLAGPALRPELVVGLKSGYGQDIVHYSPMRRSRLRRSTYSL